MPHFVWVNTPTSVLAGTNSQVTLKIVDDAGNLVTGYTNKVTFTSSDSAFAISPLDSFQTYYTFKTSDAGQKVFTIKFNTAGNRSLTATDMSLPTRTASFTAAVGDVHLAWVSPPSSVMAGTNSQVTLKIVDDAGNLVTGYTNKVTFTSSDSAFAISPLDSFQTYYTFKTSDAGQKVFTIKFNTAGNRSLTATDMSLPTRTASFTAAVGDVHLAWVSPPSSVMAGTNSQVTLKIVDDAGNLVTGYTNKVTFTSSDSAFAISPLDSFQTYYTFKTSDAGQKVFTIKFNTAGSRSLTATDLAMSGRSASFTASVGDVHLVWVDPPSSAIAGTSFPVILKAVDDSGALVTGYTNKVRFTSTDTAFTISPLDFGQSYYTFALGDAGQKTFTAKFNTAGSRSLTATDVSLASRTTSFTAAVHTISFVWSPASATVFAGQELSATLRILDETGSPVDFTGTVNFTSSDSAFTISPTNLGQVAYTFVTADHGEKPFTIRFANAGSQTLTATDAAYPARAAVLQAAVNQVYFQLLLPTSADAGSALTATLRAVDGSGNPVPYTGKIRLTSTNSTFSFSPTDLGQNYHTLVTGDGGQHEFSVFLRGGGSQTVTAAETGSPNRSGSVSIDIAAVHLHVVADANANTGDAMAFTVSARRADNSTATGFQDVVNITSSDPGFTASSINVFHNYTFLAGDAGSHTFTGQFANAGSQSISVAWVGQTVSATVEVANPHLELTAPASVQAGVPVTVVLSAKDPSGNLVTSYRNQVTATSTDTAADLGGMSGYTFTAEDAGSHSFTVVFRTPGSRTITVIDSGNTNRRVTGSAVQVLDTVLSVTAPSSTSAGAVTNIAISAKTASGEFVTGFRETIAVSSTDPHFGGTGCDSFSFSEADAGVHVVSCRLPSAGSQTVTATNVARLAHTATSSPIAVGETHLHLSLDPAAPSANQPATLTVTAVDAADQTVTAFGDSVALTSSDAGFEAVPSTIVFTPADGGVKTATVTFSSDLAAWLQVTDTGNPSRYARISNKNTAGIVVTVPSPTYQGAETQVEIQILGPDGLPDPDFVGLVLLTSTDPHVSLISAYAFDEADSGHAVFPVTFNTAGNQTINVNGGGLSGTSAQVEVGAIHFVVTPDASSVQAGTVSGVTVTVKDEDEDVVSGYSNTVAIRSTDPAAVIDETSYEFVPATDGGIHHFAIMFETAGPASVTATDAAAQVSASGSLTVLETHFELTLSSASTHAGVPITATVRALDPNDAVVTDFVGRVTVSSAEDPGLRVIKPPLDLAVASTYDFTAGDSGVHAFVLRFATAGSVHATVTDSYQPTRTVSLDVSVAETRYALSLSETSSVSSQSELVVTAVDLDDVPLDGYRGHVEITADGGGLLLAGRMQWSDSFSDGASQTIGVTFRFAGSHTVTVTDIDNASRHSSVSQAVGATELRVVAPPRTYLSAIERVSVMIVDPNGSNVPYTKGITLTATTDDPNATWPEGNTYIPDADAVSGHVFPVIFHSLGSHTVTVTDDTGRSATSAAISVESSTFGIGAEHDQYQDVPFYLNLYPLTQDGRTVPNYAATVSISTTDPGAKFRAPVTSDDEFTFGGCACALSAVVVELHKVGDVDITVTDGSTTRTITVDVSSTNTVPSPFTHKAIVQARQGDIADYYLDSTMPWTLLYLADLGPTGQPLPDPAVSSMSGGGGLPSLRPTASLTYSGPPKAVLPTFNLDEQHGAGVVSFSKKSLTHGHVVAGAFIPVVAHLLYIRTSLGVSTVQINNTLRFDMLTGEEQSAFAPKKIDEGDPIVSFRGVGRDIEITAAGSGVITRVQWATDDGLLNDDNSVSGGTIIPFGPGTRKLNMAGKTYRDYIGCSLIPYNMLLISYTFSNGRHASLTAYPEDKLPLTMGECPPPGGGDGQNDEMAKELAKALDLLGAIRGFIGHILSGDPVDTLTGAYQDGGTDLSLGGPSPSLTLTRAYSSPLSYGSDPGASDPRLFGKGWSSTLDWQIVQLPTADNSLLIVRTADGARLTFDSEQGYKPKLPSMGTLTHEGSTYVYREIDGLRYVFNSSGRLITIAGNHGQQIIIAYGGNLPISMTDSHGQSITLTNDGTHITRASLSEDRYVTYTYTATGQLYTVTAVDGTSVRYVYDGFNRITDVYDGLNNHLIHNLYGTDGALLQQTDPLGRVTTYDTFQPGPANGLDVAGTTITGPDGTQTTDCYNLNGYLTDRVDANYNIQSWIYDENFNPVSATDALGRTTKYQFDPQGRPLSATDPTGRSVTFTYDGDHYLQNATTSDGIVISYNAGIDGPQQVTVSDGTHSAVKSTYTYTAEGQVETITEAGGTTHFGYDSRGYLASITDPSGGVTTIETDEWGNAVMTVDALGNAPGADPEDHSWVRTFDAGGRILTSTDPLGATSTYTYNRFGSVATVTSPLGFLTSYSYDDGGRLTSTTAQISEAESVTTSFEYKAGGLLAAVIDGEGRRTSFEYDLAGNRTVVRDQNGKEWHSAYDAEGRVLSTTDPTGRTTAYEYNLLDDVTKVTDPGGHGTTYTYDDKGLLISVEDQLEHETTYGYDWLGQQTSITNQLNQQISISYDDYGNVQTVTDALGNTTTFGYDSSRRLTSVLDAADGETQYDYDIAGRLETATNARGYNRGYGYDALGQLTSTTDELNRSSSVAYDLEGRVDHSTDAKSQTTWFTYDRLGRVLTVTPPSSPVISFSYDKTGRRLSMTDGNGQTTYGYDDLGNLTQTTRGASTVGYAYDDAGRPTSVTYPNSAGTVGYAYDMEGRLSQITDWASRVTTFGYDSGDRLTSVGSPGGVAQAIGYTNIDQVASIDYTRNGSGVLSLGYTYDDAGNVLSISDDEGLASFGYDDLNRLVSASYPGAQNYAYTYDEVGNILAAATPGGTVNHTYDAANQISDAGYVYDANGSLTADGSRTYTYDSLNRLVGVSGPGETASYTLDGDGNRLSETVNGDTTTFDLDLRGYPTILAANGRKYLPGDPGAGFEQNGQWTNYLTDIQGSVLRSVDSNGTVGWPMRYDPYGGLRAGSASPDGIGYTGEWTDPTGLVNLRARAYDPSAARFVSADTFGGVATITDGHAGGRPIH